MADISKVRQCFCSLFIPGYIDLLHFLVSLLVSITILLIWGREKNVRLDGFLYSLLVNVFLTNTNMVALKWLAAFIKI